MKTKFMKTTFSLVALGMTFTLFSANEGCNINLMDGSSGDYSSDAVSDSSQEDSAVDNRLLVTGSGEFLTVSYNTIDFAARLNWDSGLYFFAPDPEGKITGDKIICAASIDDNEVEGDCFRSSHVCHFNYWHDDWTTVDNKDVYYLGTTSCKKGGEVGPFLVPLDSPLCGEDPFPTCPSDDIFPDGPTDTQEDNQTGDKTADPASDQKNDHEGDQSGKPASSLPTSAGSGGSQTANGQGSSVSQ